MMELREKTNFAEASYCNMPNLLFQQYCEEVYGINRGIYNTVEISFFHLGNIDIVQRREDMLSFFRFMVNKLEIPRHKNKLKFGHGGLQSALNEYMKEKQQSTRFIQQITRF